MRSGMGGHAGNIRADPTLAPRAQLGGGEKLRAGRTVGAGEKEGDWSQRVARGGGDPKKTLKIATQVSPITLETTP